VAVLQLLCIKTIGAFQIYQFNDLKHFVLNLFFASYWGLQDGFSFNAPIWSVSVEVVIYVLFFFFLKSFRLNFVNCIAWAIASYAATKVSDNPIFICSGLFALGGLLNLVSLELKKISMSRVWCAVLFMICAVFLYMFSIWNFHSAELNSLLVFSLLILLASITENNGFSLGKVGDGFGNFTYSSYLIHVPIQLSVILVMDLCFKNRSMVTSPVFFVVYLLFVLFLALVIYRVIELPAKIRLLEAMERR
jgi:peptidoglycan/LPS O-acetylase OafA/YrhL